MDTVTYKKISQKKAKKMMDTEDVFIIDVRMEEEYNMEHIIGAINVELDDILENDIEAKELEDKDAILLVYCKSGKRSCMASLELIDLGYTNVYDFGGIIEWPYGTER